MPGIYSSALAALTIGVRYYIIHSQRYWHPLPTGKLFQLIHLFYLLGLPTAIQGGVCGVWDHRLSLALQIIPLMLIHPRIGRIWKCGDKAKDFCFVLGVFMVRGVGQDLV